MNYDDFIARKMAAPKQFGFEPKQKLNPKLWDWQKIIVEWALRKGRAALFEDCGLGKTIQQLEWARQCVIKTKSPALILCPLAVAEQTKFEGKKANIEVTHIRQPEDIEPSGINITNFDRLELFEDRISEFGCVVVDESSILKSFDGRTRRLMNELFKDTPYRLCCTATPAPNDFTELGQHAEFLGICKPSEMLATYFINDTFDTGTWRLKGHAESEFWAWVSSWAACITKPSDIGFSDVGFELPEVKTEIVTVNVDHRSDVGSDELFRNPHVSASQLHAENRRTLKERVAAAAEIVNRTNEPFIVWCESNEESSELAMAIPDAVEVVGSDKPEHKEKKLMMFTNGKARVIVTKPKIAGLGMNWQHCRNDIYVGLSHSFEKFYQAGKRIHRFGQKRKINRYIVQADTENGVLATIARKQQQFDTMRELVKFTASNLQGSKPFVSMKKDITKQESESWTLYNGDCVRVAKQLENDSIGFSVFSPPFADLFTYSSDIQDMGNCSGLDEFMVQFGYLIDELHRVMMPGREVAVHCCDLLATKWKDGAIEFKDFSGAISDAFRKRGFLFHSRITIWKSPVTEMQRTKAHGLLYKTLQSDSSKSRVGAADYLLVFRKRGENPVPIRQTNESIPLSLWQEIASPVWMSVDQGRVLNGEFAREDRDERHICPLQLDVIERALLLWSGIGDVVFSPFTGIGSEGFCAVKMGRKFVGAELKESYFKSACDYLKKAETEKHDLFSIAQ